MSTKSIKSLQINLQRVPQVCAVSQYTRTLGVMHVTGRRRCSTLYQAYSRRLCRISQWRHNYVSGKH